MINDMMYSFTNNINKYPFLINAPQNSLNFVNINNNKFKFLSFFYENITDHRLLKNAVYKADNTRYYYGEFIIKSNHIIPYYNEYNINFLKNVRKEKYGEFLYNKIIINENDINNIMNNLEYKQTDFDKLEGLFNQGKKTINDVLRNILSSKTSSIDSKINFIKWLNKDAKNFIERINNTQCKTNCDDKPQVEIIERIIKGFDILRKRLIERISYNHTNISSIFTFINYNYRILSLLLQTNSMSDSLLSLMKIINKCTKLSCHDIYEITELFNKRDDNLTIIEGMVEIIFGRVLRQEQIDKVREIMDDYKTKTRRVHQFMMAKGKSSVITPILAYTFISMMKKVYIIVPEHLIKQTHKTYIDYEEFFGIKPNIMSDATLKQMFLENKYDNTGIYLFDEFDSMYNPLQSNFNIIMNKRNIDKSQVEMVFKIVHAYLSRNHKVLATRYSMLEDIYNILTNKSFIKNISYGLSVRDKTSSRVCIPYSRQDSPSEGSSFSSYMITLVLTIMYFYNKDGTYLLTCDDIFYLSRLNKELFNEILDSINIEEIRGLNDNEVLIYLRNNQNIQYVISREIFIKYLHIISSGIEISSEIKNCSFIDIMQMNSIWQVGYTGTVEMKLNVPDIDLNKYQNYNTAIN
jgi:hypothetical protein